MKTLNPLQQRILALEPLQKNPGLLANELSSKIRSQGTKNQNIPWGMGWALVLAFKAGHTQALEQAAELMDTSHVLRKATNNGPGQADFIDEVSEIIENDFRLAAERARSVILPGKIHMISSEHSENSPIDKYLDVEPASWIQVGNKRIFLSLRDLDLLDKADWQKVADVYVGTPESRSDRYEIKDKIGAIKVIYNIIHLRMKTESIPYGLKDSKEAFERVFEGRTS